MPLSSGGSEWCISGALMNAGIMHLAASAQPTEAATEVEVRVNMEGRCFKSEGRSCGEAELHHCHTVRPSEHRYGI